MPTRPKSRFANQPIPLNSVLASKPPPRQPCLSDNLHALALVVLEAVLDAQSYALHVLLTGVLHDCAANTAAAISEAVMASVAVLSTSTARLYYIKCPA